MTVSDDNIYKVGMYVYMFVFFCPLERSQQRSQHTTHTRADASKMYDWDQSIYRYGVLNGCMVHFVSSPRSVQMYGIAVPPSVFVESDTPNDFNFTSDLQ